jgi:hypothetical protein
MIQNLHWKANRHQKEFFNNITAKLLHLSTGFGGGKTYGLCMKLIQLSWLNRPYHGGLVAPAFTDFKKDVLPEFEGILDKYGIPFKYHGSDHFFQFPWSTGKLYVASADKPIRGPNWAYAGINEVTLIPLVRYKEVLGRVRVKGSKVPQIASVGTPEGFASEYYDYFIETPPASLKIIYGSTDDNAENLQDDYLNTLEDAYDSRMIEAYRRGLWVNMNGSRFYYAYNEKNEDESLEPQMFSQFHVSMDFNVDPFCAAIWGFDGFQLYGVDEIELKGGEGYDTKHMIKALQARGYNPHNTIIYPDPAGRARSTKGAPDVKVLEDAGYIVRVKSKAPEFRKRQITTNNLFDKGRVKINPKRCKGLRRDFLGVEQDIVTQDKKKNNPNLTHFSDGFDYMADILFPFNGHPKATTQERLR